MSDEIQIALFVIVLFFVGAVAGIMLVGPFIWAWGRFKRFRRDPKFSLRGLIFAFTVATLLCAAFSALFAK
jgi:hypothetical protein